MAERIMDLRLRDADASLLLFALDVAIDEVGMSRRKIPIMQRRTFNPAPLSAVDQDMGQLQDDLHRLREILIRMGRGG